MKRSVLLALAVPAVILLFAEAVDRVLAGRHVGPNDEGPSTVMVLGFRNERAAINAVNRWRVRSGLATAERYHSELVLFSGGDPGGNCESELMAEYARDLGYSGSITVEKESRSTLENLEFSLSELRSAGSIAIVSNPLHAFRARRIITRRWPELSAGLLPQVSDRSGVWLLGVPLGTVVEAAVIGLRRLRRPWR